MSTEHGDTANAKQPDEPPLDHGTGPGEGQTDEEKAEEARRKVAELLHTDWTGAPTPRE